MASWITLDNLEGDNNKHNYKGRDGESLVKSFKYQQPFRFHFRYCQKVYNHINRLQSPISLDRTWDTKFWTDCNVALYLDVMEMNTVLASGHFQKGSNIMPPLDFWRHLAI